MRSPWALITFFYVFELYLLEYSSGKKYDHDRGCPRGCNCSKDFILECLEIDSIKSFPKLFPAENANRIHEIIIEDQAQLRSIDYNDLSPYKHLRKLVIRRCGLQDIGDRAFDATKELIEIDFQNNTELKKTDWPNVLIRTSIRYIVLTMSSGRCSDCNVSCIIDTTMNQPRLLSNAGSFVISLDSSNVTELFAEVNMYHCGGNKFGRDSLERTVEARCWWLSNKTISTSYNVSHLEDNNSIVQHVSLQYIRTLSVYELPAFVNCRAQGETKNTSIQWILTIYSAPRMYEIRPAKYPSRLECIVVGHPTPVLTWLRNGLVVENDAKCGKINNLGVLCLGDKNEDKVGEYTLVAENVMGSESQRVIVDNLSFLKPIPDVVHPSLIAKQHGNNTRPITDLDDDQSAIAYNYNNPINWVAAAGVFIFLLLTSVLVILLIKRCRHLLDAKEHTLQLVLLKTIGINKRKENSTTSTTTIPVTRSLLRGRSHERRNLFAEARALTSGFVVENSRYGQMTDTRNANNVWGESMTYIARSRIRISRELGEGEFGNVYLGVCSGLTTSGVSENVPGTVAGNVTTTVAIKALKRDYAEETIADFEREAQLLNGMRHSNIITFYGVSIDDNPLMLILEYMENGDLNSYLRSHGPDAPCLVKAGSVKSSVVDLLTETDLLSIACQVSAGMAHMASLRFVHGDLASRNCLVGQRLIVKIGDFGMSRDLYSCDYYRIGTECLLPVRWMSPESLLYRTFTVESDIWSFGILLWEIFTYGRQPWFELSNHEVIKHVQEGKQLTCPRDCQTAVHSVMTGCWKRLPSDRLPMRKINEQLEQLLKVSLWKTLNKPRQSLCSNAAYLELYNF